MRKLARQYVKKRAVVIGHSFVRSTKDWLRSRPVPEFTRWQMAAGATRQGMVNATLLGLERPYHSVDLFWAPLAFSDLLDRMVGRAGRMFPEVAVLNMGSNDLCKIMAGEMPEDGPRSAQALGELIFNIAVRL